MTALQISRALMIPTRTAPRTIGIRWILFSHMMRQSSATEASSGALITVRDMISPTVAERSSPALKPTNPELKSDRMSGV